ncbi:hypothetical protein [Nostocoides vanveenii]|jgi:predicted DNA-binding protein|uniref:Uncharacterized protein n=1 Tax=Nostocoides vanveenii TaxID=330835 RepID=A0ABN2L1A3_9MICO
MSDQDMTEKSRSGVKTLAIRLEPSMHAQLSLIAQLRGTTLTDEIREAIQQRLDAAKSTPELTARAGSALDALQDEVTARRAAIVALFGGGVPEPAPDTDEPKPGARRRSGGGQQ